jgi:hypothetical protein
MCGARVETVGTLAVDPASPAMQASGEAKERLGLVIQSTTFFASPAARARKCNATGFQKENSRPTSIRIDP